MFHPRYYLPQQQEVEADPATLDKLSLEQFTGVVNKAALNNHEKQAEALRKADSGSFWVANPQLKNTAKNIRLINHWLTTRGISNPLYPDFQAAYDFLTTHKQLDIDTSKKAPRTFIGVLTGQTFDDVDTLIAQERAAALRQVSESTPEEKALDSLPPEQVRELLREGERQEQLKVKLVETRKNGDAWLTLHREFLDTPHNAHLMVMQLRANNVVEGSETIQDYEVAYRQLRKSGLLSLDRDVLMEQEAEAVKQRAAKAVATPGSVWDKTTEDAMYDDNLPLDEIRRRANEQLSRSQ